LLFSHKPVLTTNGFPEDQPSSCYWVAEGGTVLLETMPATSWVGALPPLVAAIDESGQFAGTDALDRVHRAADRIAGGEQVSPEEACQFFSILFELQGQPAGSTTVIAPSEPGTVTGFTCSDRRFSSIKLTRRVDATLPLDDLKRALQAAHRRTVG
jgi:hypothetical protein